jgi:hypothetical protein
MKARFRTKCPFCRKPIDIGQTIDCTGPRAVHQSCRDKVNARMQKISERTTAVLDLYERAGFR